MLNQVIKDRDEEIIRLKNIINPPPDQARTSNWDGD
jgi:hypothetical protein